MRILVLSDIHANATALNAALEAAKDRWDLSLVLAMSSVTAPIPNEVTTKIRELGARTIRGNHDKAATDLMETDDFNPVAKAAVDWTRVTTFSRQFEMDFRASIGPAGNGWHRSGSRRVSG